MTLRDAIAAGLPVLRAEAESMMTLTLRAYEPTGTAVVDGYKEIVYTDRGTTPGKVQGSSQAGRDPKARMIRIGDVERPVLAGGVHIPISATVPVAGEQRGIGWEYVVEAIEADDDPALLNRRYLVVEVPVKSKATARRLDVVEV
jgi:hypothetical protein